MLEEARAKIARLVEAQADDVLFTSGATEANALAILGHVRARGEAGHEKVHVLYLPSAHASIVENVRSLASQGVEAEPLPLANGRVDVARLAALLRPETALVAMEAVCGETGTVWNTREVRAALDATHPGILLHVDASQAPYTEKITRSHFGADFLTFDASKISPVRGIGALIARRSLPLAPLYRGGGQERGLRPGSEAPELARVFAEALAEHVRGREAFRAESEALRRGFVMQVASIPGVTVYEARVQAPHIVHLSLPGRDTDYLVALMDEAGVAVSTRSACETDSEDGSRAVRALTGDKERALSTLRVSWGPGMTARDLTKVARALAEAVRFVDSTARR